MFLYRSCICLFISVLKPSIVTQTNYPYIHTHTHTHISPTKQQHISHHAIIGPCAVWGSAVLHRSAAEGCKRQRVEARLSALRLQPWWRLVQVERIKVKWKKQYKCEHRKYSIWEYVGVYCLGAVREYLNEINVVLWRWKWNKLHYPFCKRYILFPVSLSYHLSSLPLSFSVSVYQISLVQLVWPSHWWWQQALGSPPRARNPGLPKSVFPFAQLY